MRLGVRAAVLVAVSVAMTWAVVAPPLGAQAPVGGPGRAGAGTRGQAHSHAQQVPFPDFGVKPPDHYAGPLFRLRQDYPETLPPPPEGGFPWANIPFTTPGTDDWLRYVQAVRDYAFAGNVAADWVPQNNTLRGWYHVPWQHYGPNGREYVRGLTTEAVIARGIFGPEQIGDAQAVAVAMYNDRGGYHIGQVWRDHGWPDPTVGPFPEGTVVVKLLFTDALAWQVPYIATPCSDVAGTQRCGIEWDASVYSTPPSFSHKADEPREVRPVRLAQIDLMVKDARATEMGWTFSTLVYNGRLGHTTNLWDNLVPVGLQWGNDPDNAADGQNWLPPGRNDPPRPVVETRINRDLKQTVVNPSGELPAQHLGWNGRLAGPADNSTSSCASCHMAAQWPVGSGILPPGKTPDGKVVVRGDATWMRWFRNLGPTDVFDAGRDARGTYYPMDMSLQLTQSINNFFMAAAQDQGGYYAEQVAGAARENPNIRRDGGRSPSD